MLQSHDVFTHASAEEAATCKEMVSVAISNPIRVP